MSTLSFASRCSLLSLLTLLGGASGCTLGLRASGGCPAGEVCSDLTPDGLLFSGELVRGGSDPFVPVAARGTRHVAFGALGAAELPDYEVVTADGAIAGVTDALDGRARIEGRAAGRTLLRVVSSEDGGLLDAVPVRVEEIATVAFTPGYWFFFRAPETTGDWAYYPETAIPMTLHLEAADGTLLVDDAATVDGLLRDGWDHYRIEGLPEGTTTITVHAGERTFASDLVVTSVIESLEFTAPASELVVGDFTTVCVVGRNGARAVYGVPVTFGAGSGLTVAPVESTSPCASVEATGAGRTYVEAMFGELRVRMEVSIAADMEGMASGALRTPSSMFETPVSRVRGLRATR